MKLLLVAHYDSPRSGWVTGERAARFARRLSPAWRARLGPWRLIFWGGMAPLLPALGARMAGLDSSAISVFQLFPTLLLVIAAFLLADIALSPPGPGAYENASGAAAALAVAERLDANPPEHLDVWVVLTGAGEAVAQGMRAFLAEHRDELDPESTAVICLDGVSWGAPHYATAEGALISQPMDSRLCELAEAIASAADDDATAPRPFRTSRATDGVAAAMRGYHAITISGREDGVPPPFHRTPRDEPDSVDAQALERAITFAETLARRLDADIGRRLG